MHSCKCLPVIISFFPIGENPGGKKQFDASLLAKLSDIIIIIIISSSSSIMTVINVE